MPVGRRWRRRGWWVIRAGTRVGSGGGGGGRGGGGGGGGGWRRRSCARRVALRVSRVHLLPRLIAALSRNSHPRDDRERGVRARSQQALVRTQRGGELAQWRLGAKPADVQRCREVQRYKGEMVQRCIGAEECSRGVLTAPHSARRTWSTHRGGSRTPAGRERGAMRPPGNRPRRACRAI